MSNAEVVTFHRPLGLSDEEWLRLKLAIEEAVAGVQIERDPNTP